MSQLLTALQVRRRSNNGRNPHPAICSTRLARRRSDSSAFVAPAFADDVSQRISDMFQPGNRSQVAFGSVVGFATGYAIKRVGQLVLVFVGLEVIALQLMANNGWVIVNWPLITRDLSPHVEKGTADRVIDALKLKLPFAGSFTAGCYAGLNWS